MDHNFWHDRWQNNEIGFHETDGNPYLKKYHQLITQHSEPKIFVPLCGKTRDIAYLLSKGCEVVAAELSELAVQQLFTELDVLPEITEIQDFKVYQCQGLTVYVGDVFDLNTQHVEGVTAIYDRAALVALPLPIRQRYVKHLCQICQGVKQLVLTFCYDQSLADGPPFSIDYEHLEALYQTHYTVLELQRSAVEGGLKGLIPCDCIVFELRPR